MKTKIRKNSEIMVCIVMFATVFAVAVTMNVSAQPPIEVWVDDDWAGSNIGDPVDGHTFGVDAFASIQDGIDAVAEDGTVYVYEGYYYENVIVAKPVSLIGDITLNGDLTVNEDGDLTLDNVNLKMNVQYDGQYHIEVEYGGAMYIQNGCVITDGETDDDNQSPDSLDNHRFLFWVREGATFEMCDSELHECGYIWSPFIDDHGGLLIWADNVILHNNLISNNYWGVRLASNYNTLSSNTVAYNNKEAIILDCANHNILTHNIEHHNGHEGIFAYDSHWNDISFNNASFNTEGIALYYSSNNLLTNNDGSNNKYNGVALPHSYTNTIRENVMSQNAGGIFLGSPWLFGDVPKAIDNIIEENIITHNNIGIECGCGAALLNTIDCNTISDNKYGMRVWGDSDDNSICGNDVSNNDYGISIKTSNNNTVNDNTISNNGVGIYITYKWEGSTEYGISENNTLSYNTITYNNVGIYLDNGSVNTEIMYNNITENIGIGILCNTSYGTKVNYNNICNNIGYGMQNVDSIFPANAEYNWWGDPNGPGGVGPSNGDEVSEWVDYEPWLTAPVSTERASKEIAIAELEAVKTGDEKIDKALDHILEDLLKSLNKNPINPDEPWKEYPLWLGYSHLDPQHGHMVFDCEKEAVKKIQELLKHEDLPDSVKEACYEVIAKLMEADDDIVRILLEEAKVYAGTSTQVDHQIMLAEQELAKAEEARHEDEYDKAIDHYKKAWEHAQLAIKLAEKK